jgi:hypothetical protein
MLVLAHMYCRTFLAPTAIYIAYDVRNLMLTLVDKSLSDITNGSQLDHRADGVTLDGLVLGDAARAVGAADGLDVAATVLVASVVSSLDGLFKGSHKIERESLVSRLNTNRK